MSTVRGVEEALDWLGTEYLDIYYIHGWHEPSPVFSNDELVKKLTLRRCSTTGSTSSPATLPATDISQYGPLLTLAPYLTRSIARYIREMFGKNAQLKTSRFAVFVA